LLRVFFTIFPLFLFFILFYLNQPLRACSLGGILKEFGWFGGICERKTLFRMKKEADEAEFKDT